MYDIVYDRVDSPCVHGGIRYDNGYKKQYGRANDLRRVE